MSLTLALLLAGQAAAPQPPLAQGVPETPSTRNAAGEQVGGDIIVTARRRQERAQSVPIALSVLDSATIARTGTFSIQQISQQAPTLQYTSSNPRNTALTIRGLGVSFGLANDGLEQGVGFYVDQVYNSRPAASAFDLLDIERVEILRGPQGTLFGKNTSAGALLVNSTAPRLDGVGGDYEVSIGNYDMQLVRGAVNAPINDKLALRVAGMWMSSEGFITDPNSGEDYNDRHPRALKAQLLYQATDAVSFRLIADWSEEDANCCYGQMDDVDGPTQPIINGLIAARGLQAPSSKFSDYEQVLSNNTAQSVSDKGVVLHTDWEQDSGNSLHSVTAYRRWDIHQDGMDADFTGANILTINEFFESQFFSQEVTYNGKLGEIGFVRSADYVLGAYYSDEDIAAGNQLIWGDQAQSYFDTLLSFQGAPPGTVDTTDNPNDPDDHSGGLWSDSALPAKSRSYAAFMHWDLKLTEAFSTIAGVRYSHDYKKGSNQRSFFTSVPNTPFRVLGVQPGPEYSETLSDDAVSGTLGLQYTFTQDVMGYATYSRGYKSGGVNIDNTAAGTRANNPAEVPGAVPLSPKYKPEYVDGFELGLKTEYLGRRARSNLAVFYDDMKDLQVAQFLGTQFTIINAPKATVYGAELENSLLLSEALTAGLDLTWLAKAEFDDAAELLNLSGRDFAQAPTLAGNLSLSLDQPVADGYAIVGRAAAQYTGKQYTNTSNDIERDAKTEYNFSVGLKSLQQHWTLSAWCQNCSDERYVVQHFNSPLQTGDSNGYVSVPRTYGLTFRGSF